ncbi:MAG: hypothetical protein WBG90_13375 [Saonia sp.]
MRKFLPVNFSENSRRLAATANGSILEGLVDLLKYERVGAWEKRVNFQALAKNRFN